MKIGIGNRQNVRYALTLLGAIATILWAGWVTVQVSNPPSNRFARIQLQSLISEYISKQARSASSPEAIGAQTKLFMATLNQTVGEYGNSGTILLVNEAIVGSDIPDVTNEVRAKVYQKVPEPKVVSNSSSLEQQMSSFFGGTE